MMVVQSLSYCFILFTVYICLKEETHFKATICVLV